MEIAILSWTQSHLCELFSLLGWPSLNAVHFPVSLDDSLKKKKGNVLFAQLYLTLCDPMDCSPPGSSVCEILLARILEWVVIPLSRDLPDPGIVPGSPELQADSLPSEPPGHFTVSLDDSMCSINVCWTKGEGPVWLILGWKHYTYNPIEPSWVT